MHVIWCMWCMCMWCSIHGFCWWSMHSIVSTCYVIMNELSVYDGTRLVESALDDVLIYWSLGDILCVTGSQAADAIIKAHPNPHRLAIPSSIIYIIHTWWTDWLINRWLSKQHAVLSLLGWLITIWLCWYSCNRLKVFLQLEGKNLGVIMPDADLDVAVQQVVVGTTSYNGQRCTAIKLVMVSLLIMMSMIMTLMMLYH